MENFVLPEKWCIKACDEFANWIKDYELKHNMKFSIIGNYKQFYYSLYDENNLNLTKWYHHEFFPDRHIEITFDQFIKYVVNKEVIPEEPVIDNLDYLKELLIKLEIK